MSTVTVTTSGDTPSPLPVDATDAVNAAQAYLAATLNVLTQVQQNSLTVQEYAAIAQAAASAAAANAAKAYNRTVVSDTSYTALITDIYIEYTTVTAARVVTLPQAALCVGGRPITIADASGSCSNTNTITLALNSNDSWVGVTSAPSLGAAGASLQLYPTSQNSWVVRG